MTKLSPIMILPVLAFSGFVGLAVFGMGREDRDSLPSAHAGKTAPHVTLTTFGEKPIWDSETLRDGNLKLVNYWASWCGPCRVEHPNLTKLASQGMAIYGVNYKDQPAQATAFLEDLGDPYTAQGIDAQGRMALDWGVYGVPETYLVDGEGTIILRIAGPVTQRVISTILQPAIENISP